MNNRCWDIKCCTHFNIKTKIFFIHFKPISNVKVVKLNSSSKVASIYRWDRLSKNIPEDHESGERRAMNLSGDWVWKNEKKKMHLDKPNIREEKREKCTVYSSCVSAERRRRK
jgi:hypothetical protein